ncbi:MAG: outer membrane beta-barrel protein [Saprospiraceae bacterium]
MFYIKELILSFIASVIIFTNAYSQRASDNFYFNSFKTKNYYFGFAIGTNQKGYNLNHSKHFIGNDQIRIAEPITGVGFNLKLITNIKLGNNFDFRFLPGFAYSEYQFELTEGTSSNISQIKAQPFYLELPFLVRYKSQPYKDKRFFVIAGLKYGFDVAGKSNTKEPNLRFSPHDFQWEVGLGIQFFYPYFIFAPEIKFSRGLNNSLIYDNASNEIRILENIFSHVIELSLNFEG